MTEPHRYRATCTWTGSTAAGYEHYQRTHRGTAPPARASLDLSADPGFHGDPALLDPEQLVVLAAASCQLLSFLAVAARARLDVVEYHDEADGEMRSDIRPPQITRIELHPRIVVQGDADVDRIRKLVDLAHKECFIANSLTSEITVMPDIVVRPAG
jgi:organic hydroperoxide reductase OsmC/OhrA